MATEPTVQGVTDGGCVVDPFSKKPTTLAEQFHVALNGHWEPVGWWRQGETTIHTICVEQDECVQLFRFVEPED